MVKCLCDGAAAWLACERKQASKRTSTGRPASTLVCAAAHPVRRVGHSFVVRPYHDQTTKHGLRATTNRAKVVLALTLPHGLRASPLDLSPICSDRQGFWTGVGVRHVDESRTPGLALAEPVKA
jgi:hypothetical protein